MSERNRDLGDLQAIVTPGGSVIIIKADPLIMISTELLEVIRSGGLPRDHYLYSKAPVTIGRLDQLSDPDGFTGATLVIEAENRTVIYLIGDKVPDLDAYFAEWPG